MELARKVRYARLIRDLSQQQLADRAGLSVSTIVRVEAGKGRLPREGTVRALATALRVMPRWLTDEGQDLADLHRHESAQAGGGPSADGAAAPDGAPWDGPHGQGDVRLVGGHGGAGTGEVQDLLRQAIRAIERSGARPQPPPAVPPEPIGDRRDRRLGVEPWAPSSGRMAPVFDIGADLDRDWHDGGFPTGHGHDGRPAFNGDPSGFWCVLRGDSMEPELLDGDLLYFSPEWTRPSDGDICLVRTHDFATVKRFFKIGPTTARLAASNPRYADRIVDLVEDVVQLHKVLCFVRSLD